MWSITRKKLFLGLGVLVLQAILPQAEAQCAAGAQVDSACTIGADDVSAGCSGSGSTGICRVVLGEMSCIAPDSRTRNGEDCGMAISTCACFSGVCVEDDLSSLCVEPGMHGDPHVVGLKGQKFDFTGQDQGMYNMVHDGDCDLINMRVTALPGTPVITYITGLGMLLCGDDGEQHSIEIEVKEPHNLQTACPSGDVVCLAEGSITMKIDGEEHNQPGEYSTGDGVSVSCANIPGECRPFGFEKYWLNKQHEAELTAATRSLRESKPMSEWILSDKLRTNPVECQDYVHGAVAKDSLFAYESEHVSFQITSPSMSMRINHGKIHQLAMRDPTDTVDLPDHIAYQMNVGFDKIRLGPNPQGIVGETVHPVLDIVGDPVMNGMGAIRGGEEDYRVDCLLCGHFDRYD